MTERPILFSGEMVRAILIGRKTQTRRAIERITSIGRVTDFGKSHTEGFDWTFRDRRMLWNDFDHGELMVRCPYGVPGDRLWVREPFRPWWDDDPPSGTGLWCCVQYKDGVLKKPDIDDENEGWVFAQKCDQAPDVKWTPGIHMPRWASRITLEITGVRVERVQDITEADAMAEGCCKSCGNDMDYCAMDCCRAGVRCPEPETYRGGFKALWDRINAKRGYGWAANPWVWVVEFRRIPQ